MRTKTRAEPRPKTSRAKRTIGSAHEISASVLRTLDCAEFEALREQLLAITHPPESLEEAAERQLREFRSLQRIRPGLEGTRTETETT